LSGRRDSKPSPGAANARKSEENGSQATEHEPQFSRPFLDDGSFGPARSQRHPDDIAFEMALAEHAERGRVVALLARPLRSVARGEEDGSVVEPAAEFDPDARPSDLGEPR